MKGDQHRVALSLLGEILEARGGSPHWFIVCGGSALQAQGIILRATKDVDIFASRDEFTGVEPAYPLGKDICDAIGMVSRQLNLPPDWLNAATSFFQLPLNDYPEYFWEDLKDEEYGTHLKISYLSRKGLTTLKILAALQRDEPRDIEDLLALAPSEHDTMQAIDWCLATSVELPHGSAKIQLLLKALNHESLRKKYQR